ncbi:MAG: hypothetical protein HDT35_00250 [Clostridiales bacterium]|nr:hypothetical protein [Clostridiales bacterium]
MSDNNTTTQATSSLLPPPPQMEEPIPPWEQKKPTAAPAPSYKKTRADEYFSSGQFDKDVAAYQAYGKRTTGYANLDHIQPFYPGFYVLGAISSLGKTTFAHQMADQLASAGEHVLYFSLEQNRFELYSKSLARGFGQTNRADAAAQNRPSSYPTPSSIDLRRGEGESYPTEMADQVNQYTKAVEDRMIIIDGAFSLTVEDIAQIVNDFIHDTKCKPVVIVDYLQIVAPSTQGNKTLNTKESVDYIVHTLKALQSDDELTVIVISSLNRQNYMTPIDYESFKESGGIEYTADVVWGLQLAVMSEEIFNKEGKIKEKRETIRDAKSAMPRAIDLVCLKNRYGIANYTVHFDYYPKSDMFVPVIGP